MVCRLNKLCWRQDREQGPFHILIFSLVTRLRGHKQRNKQVYCLFISFVCVLSASLSSWILIYRKDTICKSRIESKRRIYKSFLRVFATLKVVYFTSKPIETVEMILREVPARRAFIDQSQRARSPCLHSGPVFPNRHSHCPVWASHKDELAHEQWIEHSKPYRPRGHSEMNKKEQAAVTRTVYEMNSWMESGDPCRFCEKKKTQKKPNQTNKHGANSSPANRWSGFQVVKPKPKP